MFFFFNFVRLEKKKSQHSGFRLETQVIYQSNSEAYNPNASVQLECIGMLVIL